MKRLVSALVLAAVAVPAQAQQPVAAVAVKPAVDAPKDRETMRKLSVCLAEHRPRWAKTMLAYPYLSDSQARTATEVVSGWDTCLTGWDDVTMSFRTSTIVGALAEHYVRSGMAGADVERVSSALSAAVPLNASEDFALCVASHNPAAAIALVRSEPGSAQEVELANTMAAHVTPCTKPTEELDVDLQALRSLVATALYRGIAGNSAG